MLFTRNGSPSTELFIASSLRLHVWCTKKTPCMLYLQIYISINQRLFCPYSYSRNIYVYAKYYTWYYFSYVFVPYPRWIHRNYFGNQSFQYWSQSVFCVTPLSSHRLRVMTVWLSHRSYCQICNVMSFTVFHWNHFPSPAFYWKTSQS